ncbi:winged helix-turn-helix transcriptional regulator [Leptolyngbya sp. AN03gr2]|uniref:winged helix-turn-helix transcriptional regulator n=1 Tax=unclassified Leptolyngbya TaxID=2650499 RepID=UPI003D3153F5
MNTVNDCLDVKCPIQFVVDLLGNKWSILVLRELFTGSRRTHELLAALPGISTKTLMIRLRELEEYGLIDRQVFAEVPPHVEYSLTAKGRQIQPVMAALYQVGTQWLDQDPCACPLQRIES